ncbi:protein SDA1 homolog isoform X2 [Xenia sp. Carnegie-2017]|uniref:protein SDA1 homolog isoform X2 n=1 Tax=Xenia sp. Carnegie-2017 TaxID=2897299 RepID=UPI001F03AF73|nr:protein SDA1 homolog isoform X2 [Xenia sp. Carnegie-2017]
MSRRKSNQLPNNLPQLQNVIKRDPLSYKDEFLQQYRHYQSNLAIFKINPLLSNQVFEDLAMFLSQVSHCYTNELEKFPQEIIDILTSHYMVMNPDVRMTLCRSLILLRNKGLLSPTSLLELFFLLFRCNDKLLRKTLYTHIVKDIRNINAKHKNNKVNSTLQNFMYTILNDSHALAAKKSLDVMIELYQKNIWRDVKTVNVISTACFSHITKISVTALKFLLEKNQNDDSESESEDDKPTEKQLLLANRVRKKTRKSEAKLKIALKNMNKQKKKHSKCTTFSALYLINDPQGFCERLFKKLGNSTERFEVRVLMMNVLACLIGVHQPHQKEVTSMLTFYAQACHELVPSEIVEPGLKAIVNNFVTERNSNEVIAVGINAVKEVCIRCPLVMTEQLLRDLAAYKKSKNKSVFNASRSLIQQFRLLNPSLLHEKDRGKMTVQERNVRPNEYGEMSSKNYVPGAELLDENEQINEYDVESSEDECSDIFQNKCDDNIVQEECGENTIDNEEKESKAARISQSKIFTNDDFKKMEVQKIIQEVNPHKKRKHENIEETTERKELLHVEDIEQIISKKKRSDKDERVASVKAGRDGVKRSFQKNRCNEYTSTTNKEKKKNKTFMMVKHKVKGKTKKSFREKQIALRDSLLKKKRKTKF